MFLPRGKEKNTDPVARLSDVSSQKWLMVPDSCGLASTTRALFSSRRLPFAQARQRALGYHVLEQWSEAGLGAAILPASKVIRPARAVPLVDERGRPLSLAIDAWWLARAGQTPATRRFVTHLKRVTQ